MIVIAAVGENRVIGQGSGLPWDVPEEYRHFLGLVDGQTVIMGRRSWEIFGADLTTTHAIVVSRSLRELPGATVASSLESAVEQAERSGRTVFSAGGAGIYAQTIPLADRMYLSLIKGPHSGDAYFPAFPADEWREAGREDHPEFEFVIYERIPDNGGPSGRSVR